jgi:hypothetical protein
MKHNDRSLAEVTQLFRSWIAALLNNVPANVVKDHSCFQHLSANPLLLNYLRNSKSNPFNAILASDLLRTIVPRSSD